MIILGQKAFLHNHDYWRVLRGSSVGDFKLPAVDHHRASIRRSRGFHSSYKRQQPGGVIGHTVLRPGREVKLTNLVLGRVSSLAKDGNVRYECFKIITTYRLEV